MGDVRGHHRNSNIHPTVVGIIAALPVLLFFAYATGAEPISPFYSNYDPEFQYLLNSLEVYKGNPYYYADHPGGPVEMIGSAIYASTLPFIGLDEEGFIGFHLGNPRVFLTLAHAFITTVSAATLVYLSRVLIFAQQRRRGVLSAAFGLVYFVVHPGAFDSLMLWSHNSFSFAFGTLLLAMLYRLLSRVTAGDPIPGRPLTALSLGAGLLAAVTIYLTAWAVGFLVIVAVWCALTGTSWRQAFRSLVTIALGCIGVFFIGVLPLMHRMSYFFDWIVALLTHRSTYLLGTQNQTLLIRWTSNLGYLASELPLLFGAIFLLAGMAVIALVRRNKSWHHASTAWAFTIGGFFQCLLLTASILDHPKPEYMLAVAAILPVLVIGILDIYYSDAGIGRLVHQTSALLALGGVALALTSSILQHAEKARQIAEVERQTNLLQETYAQDHGQDPQNLNVVWTYGTYSPCLSWWFGNDATDNAFRKEIGRMCPRQLMLDMWSQRLVPAKGVKDLDETPWDMIIGCSDAFKIPALSRLANIETFPALRLSCGNLTVAYSAP